jgi:hypothetical protein
VLGIGGIEVKTGVEVGRDVTLESSRRTSTRCSSASGSARHLCSTARGEELAASSAPSTGSSA